MNNILLEVINIRFSTLKFIIELKLFLHRFSFCVQRLSGGHHPSHCTGAHDLRSYA